jgi:hypothetical protein
LLRVSFKGFVAHLLNHADTPQFTGPGKAGVTCAASSAALAIWAAKRPELRGRSRLPWTRGPPKAGRVFCLRILLSMIWRREGGAPERSAGRDTRDSSGAATEANLTAGNALTYGRSGTEKTVIGVDEMGRKACGGP